MPSLLKAFKLEMLLAYVFILLILIYLILGYDFSLGVQLLMPLTLTAPAIFVLIKLFLKRIIRLLIL